ncbi:MAG: hypothetical protein GX295_02015 [Syntrophomonadaceae bacterium]|mgnify:FL=1|nr:hypothetical protein [Syntrophomonadaceae bacterium]
MGEEWKAQLARNLDRELESRGYSNSERARAAYHQYRQQVFSWIRAMAEAVQKKSRNPNAVLAVEDSEALTVSIGTEMIRLKATPYPLCSRGWGKINLTATNQLPFKEIFLWSKGDSFTWIIMGAAETSQDQAEAEIYLPGREVNQETIEELFQDAFRKYLKIHY